MRISTPSSFAFAAGRSVPPHTIVIPPESVSVTSDGLGAATSVTLLARLAGSSRRTAAAAYTAGLPRSDARARDPADWDPADCDPGGNTKRGIRSGGAGGAPLPPNLSLHCKP